MVPQLAHADMPGVSPLLPAALFPCFPHRRYCRQQTFVLCQILISSFGNAYFCFVQDIRK
jgi:hypothetical protein